MKKTAGLAALLALLSPSAHAVFGDGRPWTDKRAEVAFYDAEAKVDGKPIAFREQFITAREDLLEESLATVGDKKGRKIDALKVTRVQTAESGNFPIHTLTSVYMSVDKKPRILKMTSTLQDWTGSATQLLMAPDLGPARLRYRLDTDGEEDRTAAVPLLPGDVWEDGLPLALRQMPLEAGFTKSVRVWDRFDPREGGEPRVSTAVVTVDAEEIVNCHAGSLPTWKVTVVRRGMTDVYWMEKNEPGLLVKMQTADGRACLLYGRSRWPYWDKRIPRPNILN